MPSLLMINHAGGCMQALLEVWPLIVFITSLFLGGMAMAAGLTMWVLGKLSEQDAKRIEVKEAILKEMRERHHTAMSRSEQLHGIQNDKLDELRDEVHDLTNRATKLETMIDSNILNALRP